MVDVIILNGGSSSGKSTIAKCLQNLLPTPWLRFSIDDLIDAMPDAMLKADSGIKFGDDGSVSPGTEFRTLEFAWMHGIGEKVRRGAQVIIEDVFISGVEACNRWEVSLEGLQVLWVGVFCDPTVASARERERGDRVTGMAVSQATTVHVGIHYDIIVDTTKTSPEECARIIRQRINP
ncbi:chloramphenicol phosphotransferase [Cytobacillus depressus]|uniref:Chloramphenicol phosphotransferase n=1 Tax=Cytobacillus depressus TaxID=1602942 RepID=A0A6L3V1E5_9BACI|nr:chloramphenicol phosphotransferase [Cytobacillus depressus]KAB2329531.1 chloramphenicol phosphotransferase [Cytobacillus depressus]